MRRKWAVVVLAVLFAGAAQAQSRVVKGTISDVATGEAVPRARAQAFYRWALVVALGTFDIAIFTKVIQGIILVW